MKNELNSIVKNKNAVIGFASIDRFDNLPHKYNPKYYMSNCKTVIVLGIKIPHSVFYCDNYGLHFIQKANIVAFDILDELSQEITNYLESKNIKSIPIPSFAPMKLDNFYPQGLISLKNAAVQAGLGKLGKNDIVYHNEYGGFIRFSSIITEVDIEADKIDKSTLCNENCRICIDKCPAKAITDKGYDRKKCFKYTFDHGLKPMMMFNLNKIEKLMNTSFYNYWSNCCECTINCPMNIKSSST